MEDREKRAMPRLLSVNIGLPRVASRLERFNFHRRAARSTFIPPFRSGFRRCWAR
jgi:hypothetical protein